LDISDGFVFVSRTYSVLLAGFEDLLFELIHPLCINSNNLTIASENQSSLVLEDAFDDVGQFVDHEFVINDYCDLLALLVKLQCLACQPEVFFFCSYVVKDNHLHVHPVVTLLEQSFLLALLTGLLDLRRQLSLDLLYMGSSLQDSLQGIIVLLHLAINSRFVQVRRNHVVLFLIALVPEDMLFQLDSISNSS
jgi:hypothetical protein